MISWVTWFLLPAHSKICAQCWPLTPVVQSGTTTTMPQNSVSVDPCSSAVMATRWILELTTVQHPQGKNMITMLVIVHSHTLSTVPTDCIQRRPATLVSWVSTYNRRGLLCGECKDGYGPAVYSFDMTCANCSSLWSRYAISLCLFLQFVPTTLIFLCLVAF